jgi:AcrR family transcriptional regulator
MQPGNGDRYMRNRNTKKAVIYHALALFSDRGYDGVSMRDIASAVGIKAASLYNHFKSKEDIFMSIIDEMSKRYKEAITTIQLPHGEINEVADEYMHLSEEALVSIAKKMFLYFLKDDFASKFRRMLTIEQFGSLQARDAFQNLFINGPINFEKILFKNMMEQGGFIKCDPYIMALHFYSPIFLLLNKYDHLPVKEDEAVNILENHIKQFSSIYKNIQYDETAKRK